MDLAQRKLALFDAHLSHKGLQHLVDTAAALFGNPLFMADLSMGIVFKSSDMGPGALDYSAEHDPDRQLALAKQAADAGYLDWIYHHDEPVIGAFAGQPRYLAARVRDGVQVLGHVVVSEANRPFTADDEQLLPVVCQTISFELRRTRPDDDLAVEYAPLLRELLSGAAMDEDVVRKRMASMGHPLPASVRVLVFRPTDPSRIISLTYLRSQLLQVFRHSVGIVWEGEEVHVVDGAPSLDEVSGRLAASVYTGGLAVGASWSHRDATKIGLAYLQADAALRLGQPVPEGEVAPYDAAVVPFMGERAFPHKEDTLDAFVLPQLRLLIEFDRRDGTELVRSLSTYLNAGRNVAKAARELNVHKNSVYYRLQRIEELTGIDVSDERTCFLLQFSLALMGGDASLA